MNKEFISIIERMGYKVLNENDTLPLKITDANGKIVNNKVYKIFDENKRYILVNRFSCNKNQRISIYSNGIIDIKVNRGLSIIANYNEETKTYTIRLKVDYSHDKSSSENEKNMIIDICHSRENNEPGYVHVYENNIINGEIVQEELGSLEQKRAYFTLNGKKKNMYSGNYTVDNYVDAVLNIISKDRDFYYKKNFHDGVDLVIPTLYDCLDKLLVNWLDNLDLYYERTMNEKTKVEEEISKLKSEVIQYNEDLSIMEFQKERAASLKKHRRIFNHDVHLID